MSINLLLPQVTRIPITGPEPYNTLVCVQTTSKGGPQDVRPGRTSRYQITVPTKFRLAGFDQRVVPVFDHSTTAFISSIGPAEDDTWLYAVDEVVGVGFDQLDGSFFVNINMALMPGEPASSACISYGDPSQGGVSVCYYFLTVQIVSYILCYEPSLPAPPRSLGLRTSSVFVDKVPERRVTNMLEQAALQFGKPFSLSPKQDAKLTSRAGNCDGKQK